MGNKPNAKSPKKEAKTLDKNFNNEVYLPKTNLPMTGEMFNVIFDVAKVARAEGLVQNFDTQGNRIGVGVRMDRQSTEINELYNYLESIHRQYVAMGLSVPLEEYKEVTDKEKEEVPVV